MKKRRPKKVKLPSLSDELIGWLDAAYEMADPMPDGAWWAMLEEAVAGYNREHGTTLDENETVHAYLHLRVNR